MKVIVAYKNPSADNPNACHAGLGVTAANAAEMLTEHGIPAEVHAVVDGFQLRARLRAGAWPGVTALVMCAPFFDTPFLEKLCAEFPALRFAVVFHSNVGFLGVDNWSTGVLGEQVALEMRAHNFRVAANSAKFCRAVSRAYNAPCALLPNLYFLHGPIERKRPNNPDVLRIGAFGATRILKNLPTAAWATRIIANHFNVKTELWVSAGRTEGDGATSVVANIRKLFASAAEVTLVEAPWSTWLEFRRGTVRRMNLLLQPSFTESFNGVTADGIAEGVPSVVGPAIDWVPGNWIVNPDDAVEVAEAGMRLLGDRGAARAGYEALSAHNRDAIASWRRFLV